MSRRRRRGAHQQPANIKLARALNSRATHGNTLVMPRSSEMRIPVGPMPVRIQIPSPLEDLSWVRLFWRDWLSCRVDGWNAAGFIPG
jgi:hypothetical protein